MKRFNGLTTAAVTSVLIAMVVSMSASLGAEPSTLVILGFGLAGLGFIRRKQNKSQTDLTGPIATSG